MAIEKPEDVETASLKEVLEWMDNNLPYENKNNMKIWAKIVKIFNERRYNPPKKWWDYDPW